jgi:hypothetical protein
LFSYVKFPDEKLVSVVAVEPLGLDTLEAWADYLAAGMNEGTSVFNN